MVKASRELHLRLEVKETIMIRPALLAVLAITLAPLSSFAQLGGMGGGMGGMGGSQQMLEARTVKVEMVGGQSLSGVLRLSSVVVDTDVGQYEISPRKVKVIRFSRFVGDPGGESPLPSPIQGTVITASDQEISGIVQVPYWKLEFDYGTLTLKPAKLKTITFTAEPKLGSTPDAAAPGTSKGLGKVTPGDGADLPRYSRFDKSIVVTSPAGDQITFVDLETKKSTSVRLSESKETPLHVSPIWGPNAAALMLSGPKITRIAASNGLSGTWHTQDLREPVRGEARPIVGPGVVAYGLGRYIYAFGTEAERWDVVELPEGVRGVPIVRANSVTIEVPGHIYTFGSKTGRWNDLNIHALLETAAAKDELKK
jgi:hypothetical protein